MFFYQIRRKNKKNDNSNQNRNKILLLFHQDYSKKHLSNKYNKLIQRKFISISPNINNLDTFILRQAVPYPCYQHLQTSCTEKSSFPHNSSNTFCMGTIESKF